MIARDAPLGAALVAVGTGAVLGAWVRYGLALWLNPHYSVFPLGTLASNLIGGFLVGIAVAVVTAHPAVSPWLRLFVITGLLGGLTTFSTFSAESVAMIGAGRWAATLAHTFAHLAGSLAATALGIAAYRAIS